MDIQCKDTENQKSTGKSQARNVVNREGRKVTIRKQILETRSTEEKDRTPPFHRYLEMLLIFAKFLCDTKQ